MWDDDEFDPDSANDLAAMMEALDDAENGTADPSPELQLPAVALDDKFVATGNSQICDGAPSLRCTLPWGAMLLAESMPGSQEIAAFQGARELLRTHSQLEVIVDWHSAVHDEALRSCKLAVRRGGAELASVTGGAPSALTVTFSVADASPGEVFVAELSWESGSRTLHVLAPLRGPLPLGGLLCRRRAPPEIIGAPLPSIAWLLAPWHMSGVPQSELHAAADAALHTNEMPSLLCLPDRALGIEIEMLTLSPEPATSGYFTKAEEVHGLIAALQQRAAAAAAAAAEDDTDRHPRDVAGCGDGADARLGSLLNRIRLWDHEVDDHVAFASDEIARRTVAVNTSMTQSARAAPADTQLDSGPEAENNDAVRLLAGGVGTMKSEFKSPTPAQGALNFARGAAAEIATFLRVVSHLGCGAPALSATGNGGGSLHVHVNVRSPTAGGSPLTAEMILFVYLSWVRFDGVMARCARPWTWREPSMAPLYASGTEFLYREKAWDQGGARATASRDGLATYDVPRFVAAVRALLHAPGWSSRSEDDKVEMLFGRADGTPASQIGRYCSLNLRRLTSYGTLEIRRFHSCIDPAVVVRWAHLCVSFVETFRGGGDGLARRVLAPEVPLATALAELRAAQEAATAADLMAAMHGHVDPHTAHILMRDSGAQAPLQVS